MVCWRKRGIFLLVGPTGYPTWRYCTIYTLFPEIIMLSHTQRYQLSVEQVSSANTRTEPRSFGSHHLVTPPCHSVLPHEPTFHTSPHWRPSAALSHCLVLTASNSGKDHELVLLRLLRCDTHTSHHFISKRHNQAINNHIDVHYGSRDVFVLTATQLMLVPTCGRLGPFYLVEDSPEVERPVILLQNAMNFTFHAQRNFPRGTAKASSMNLQLPSAM